MKKLGLIVNPIAGIGGSVGLKGSDGRRIIREARKRGSKPSSPQKTIGFLKVLKKYIDTSIFLITCSGDMGENEVLSVGITPQHIISTGKDDTTAEDTKTAARKMEDMQVDLLIFCGGDGTARDIMNAIDMKIPVLGIPAGVKMESSVFTINPEAAAALAVKYLTENLPTVEREVIDVDEEAYRRNILSTKLYGYLKVPNDLNLLQGMKTPSPSTEEEIDAKKTVAQYVVELMDEHSLYIIGPGTTPKAILNELNVEGTLLGVDVLYRKKTLALDVREKDLLQYLNMKNKNIVLIVTPIGGQGYLFGRGNLQISPLVLNNIDRKNIIVVSTMSKLFSLPKLRLLVDTGDPETDKSLCGYIKVIVDYEREFVIKVERGYDPYY